MKVEDFEWVELRSITHPPISPGPHMTNIYVDYWWLIDSRERVAFFREKWRSPQCNLHRSLIEPAAASMEGDEIKVARVPYVYIPLNIHDY